MGVTTLILVTAALFLTLRNMPMMAETGLEMLFFNVLTVFAYIIPVALVAAELATGWPHNGVYHWVRAAFGDRFGWAAAWLQWIQSIFGMTSILGYIAASLAYVLAPQLGSNKFFIVGTILAVYWTATLINFKGTKLSGRISSVCVLAGVLLPTLVLITLAVLYFFRGQAVHLAFDFGEKNLIPSFGEAKNWVLFLSFVFGFVGVEVSACHARDVENPTRNYPIAIFTACIAGFVLTLLGGLAVAVLLPAQDIQLINGAVQSFHVLSRAFHVPWLMPVAGYLIALGAAGLVSTWVVGPVKGLLAGGRAGNLPPLFQKVNQKGIPRNLLLLQAALISLIACLFLIVPNPNSALLILTDLAVLLYSLMYALMFLSAIYLRYRQPDTPRPYRVPGGNWGMWLVGGVGLLTAGLCFIVGFIPVDLGKIPLGLYEGLMLGGVAVLLTAPFLLYYFKRPKWRLNHEMVSQKEV
ncbi:MAG: amino acid permease [bacterium]|nr:amino acid permease [bacterium]